MAAGVLLLAGGSSRRFGSDKRFAKLPGDNQLLDASIDAAKGSGLPLLVALRHDDIQLESNLRKRHIHSIRCAHSGQGMGSTLADGIAALPRSWSGVLIALGDMPLIRPETFHTLEQALRPGGIVAPFYRGKRGHPVGFDRSYFPQLERLSGDQGAAKIIAENPDAVIPVDANYPGVLLDIDLPGDLQAMEQR